MKKMTLRIEGLAVESFATGQGADARGTVRGQDGEGCTQVDTCLCKTAYYHCGTGPETIFSCDYTEVCVSGSWQCEPTVRCPTPPITPAC